MLKFEPEAMRALVKYKVLKKLIGQCVDRRPKKDAEGVQQEKEDEQLTEEEKERDLQAMKGLRIRILCHISRFIETIIEDVIAANQYYTKKLSAINQEYEDLSAIVSEELVKVPLLAPFHVQKRGFFSRRKRILYYSASTLCWGRCSFSSTLAQPIIRAFGKSSLSSVLIYRSSRSSER